MSLVWVGVAIFAMIVEVLTPGMLVSIWFVPAALVSMVLAFLSVPMPIQGVVFIVLSLLCIFVVRPLVSRYAKKPIATNVDAIIGEKGLVIEKIENIAGSGQIKVRGQSWSARSVDDDCTFEPGDIVMIVAVEGVKLICKK